MPKGRNIREALAKYLRKAFPSEPQAEFLEILQSFHGLVSGLAHVLVRT